MGSAYVCEISMLIQPTFQTVCTGSIHFERMLLAMAENPSKKSRSGSGSGCLLSLSLGYLWCGSGALYLGLAQ